MPQELTLQQSIGIGSEALSICHADNGRTVVGLECDVLLYDEQLNKADKLLATRKNTSVASQKNCLDIISARGRQKKQSLIVVDLDLKQPVVNFVFTSGGCISTAVVGGSLYLVRKYSQSSEVTKRSLTGKEEQVLSNTITNPSIIKSYNNDTFVVASKEEVALCTERSVIWSLTVPDCTALAVNRRLGDIWAAITKDNEPSLLRISREGIASSSFLI